jgi:hypothetical protein
LDKDPEDSFAQDSDDDSFAHQDSDDSFAQDPGPVEENKDEYHAMVLLGFRIDWTTKKKWLLFQNWWPNMQLVEVSDEYFENAGGNLVFVH